MTMTMTLSSFHDSIMDQVADAPAEWRAAFEDSLLSHGQADEQEVVQLLNDSPSPVLRGYLVGMYLANLSTRHLT